MQKLYNTKPSEQTTILGCSLRGYYFQKFGEKTTYRFKMTKIS